MRTPPWHAQKHVITKHL